MVALVGETGSGKTTIGKLLLRQYANFDGQIFVGNHSINDLAETSLKSSISMVHQDPYIFDGTIEDNIRLWSPDIDDQAMERAVRASKVDELLRRTSKGLTTSSLSADAIQRR